VQGPPLPRRRRIDPRRAARSSVVADVAAAAARYAEGIRIIF